MAWSKGSRTPWKRLVAAWAPRGIRRSGGARSSASCELGVGWHEAALDQMPRAPARPCWSRSVGAQVIERGVAGSARPGHVGGCAAGLRGREFQQLDAGRPTVRAPRAHPLGLTPRAFHVAVLWARTMVTGAGRSSSWAWGGTGRPAGRSAGCRGRIDSSVPSLAQYGHSGDWAAPDVCILGALLAVGGLVGRRQVAWGALLLGREC